MNVQATWGTKATVTVTLTSLANNAARESTVIDTAGAIDIALRIKTKGQASSTGPVNVYAYAALGDTVYTDGATGVDAAFTAANRLNSRFVGAVQLNAANSVTAMLTVAQAFDGALPSKVGFIIVNNSGDALSTTAGDHVVEAQMLTLSAT